MVLDFGRYKYNRIKLKAPGSPVIYSANNADAVSRAMLGMTKPEVVAVAKENGIKKANSEHFSKNAGHVRMIVGQALRSIIKKGGKVSIAGLVIEALDQPVDWPRGYKEVPYVYRK